MYTYNMANVHIQSPIVNWISSGYVECGTSTNDVSRLSRPGASTEAPTTTAPTTTVASSTTAATTQTTTQAAATWRNGWWLRW